MFLASSAHLQEDTVVHMQHMAMSFSTEVRGYLSVHSSVLKLFTDRQPRTLIESDSTICCTYVYNCILLKMSTCG